MFSILFKLRPIGIAVVAGFPVVALAQEAAPSAQALASADEPAAPIKKLGVVVITGGRSTSLPSQIPTTIEGITGEQIQATVNATDSEDALKYFPSLLVRKRYIGDYNHAVLSTRASGTGNSARSMVYADGILLSNLLGNGATFTPRWGLVTPEEIERVDVLYGPFSAAYPGNSVGAVVDYLTRMPTKFEAHAKVGAFAQPFELYNTRTTYSGWQASASLGNREGGLAWWLNLNRLDSEGQPLVFATRLVSAGAAPGGSSVPVSGAVLGNNRSDQPWYILGTSTQYHTVQDHLKAKLSYDLSPTLRAHYTLGWWNNTSTGRADSYLRDAAGNTVYSGSAVIDGRAFTLSASDFPQSREGLEHWMHALSLKSNTQGAFDWELAASVYDYRRDLVRAPTVALPAADAGGAGRATDMQGTGWNTLAARGTWRPAGEHVVDAGLQQDSYQLRTTVSNVVDWIAESSPSVASRFDGKTRLRSAYAQDAWRFAEGWMTVLGLRAEHWEAYDGLTQTSGNLYQHPQRSETRYSPKAALSRQIGEGWVLKASTGRAVRFPTVSELFQGAATASGVTNIANPDLRPERSWTTELSSEWALPQAATLRVTLFHEDTRDALFSQALPGVTPITNSVQNVDHVRTLGLETAWQGQNVAVRGLDLQGSVTYADSKIVANTGYVSVPGDTVGKWQPRVPQWRASALASWRANDLWTVSYGARYSGVQYSSLDNSDVNGFAYQGASRYFTTDLRMRYALSKQWHAAVGIDNLNNDRYWNFHPYPQRTYSAELKFDH